MFNSPKAKGSTEPCLHVFSLPLLAYKNTQSVFSLSAKLPFILITNIQGLSRQIIQSLSKLYNKKNVFYKIHTQTSEYEIQALHILRDNFTHMKDLLSRTLFHRVL